MLRAAWTSTPATASSVAGKRTQAGSGTAIGVAIFFPALMLVIVALHTITGATRTEQSLQAAADRAAHSASLCCLYISDAISTVQGTLEGLEFRGPRRRLDCNNDVSETAVVTFVDTSGTVVPELTPGPELDANNLPISGDQDAGGVYIPAGEQNLVPPGGLVSVRVVCALPAGRLGAFGVQSADVRRNAAGVASIDPYRLRFSEIGR